MFICYFREFQCKPEVRTVACSWWDTWRKLSRTKSLSLLPRWETSLSLGQLYSYSHTGKTWDLYKNYLSFFSGCAGRISFILMMILTRSGLILWSILWNAMQVRFYSLYLFFFELDVRLFLVDVVGKAK